MQMHWWSWLFVIAVWPLLGWQLWTAATRGEIAGRFVTYQRTASPILFWFYVALCGAAFIVFTVAIGGGLLRFAAGVLR
jgi:hypothetical protein